MATIATGCQTKWKDSYQTSERVRLTLRCNGEEETKVITPYGDMVLAGFEAPTVDPTLVVSSGGSLTASSYYAYRYVYASTNYPYVQNAVTVADGELWPRSNPSDYDIDVTTGSNKTITVTVTKTTRSDVNKILIYRTTGHTAQADAIAAAEAGEMFYIATVNNNSVAGTTTVTDNGLTDTQELLELDNYAADTAWFTVFDGTYWWMGGNPEFVGTVTLANSSTITLSGDVWFNGRDGQVATFDGVNSGGFDGRGSYYWKWVTSTTAQMYSDADMTVLATVPFTGTTTIHLKGYSSTLFRSKPYNPFSWGLTEQIVNEDASVTRIPQSFALDLGGGAISAMALVGGGRYLKVDFENPQRSITLDLSQAESDQFGTTQRLIDDTGSVTCHFSQFTGYTGQNPIVFGVDSYNGNILACDGFRQIIVSDMLGPILRELDRNGNAQRYFHGTYDPETELNCFWVRLYDTTDRNNILVWMHAPTGEWGYSNDFGMNASCILLDDEENDRYVLGGSDEGHLGRIFSPNTYTNWVDTEWKNNSYITGTTLVSSNYEITVAMDLENRATSYSQPLASYDESAGTFTTSTTPLFQVGDTVELGDSGSGSYAQGFRGIVTAIDGNIASFSVPYTATGTPDVVIVGPERTEGVWATITTGQDQWFARLTEGVQSDTETTFTVEEYIHRGTGTVNDNEGANAPWGDNARIIFGAIPCYWRAYFDLGAPTREKRATELWITAQGVTEGETSVPFSLPDQLTSRYFFGFENTSATKYDFTLSPDKTLDGEETNVWVCKNQVPSASRKQFGLEVAELGTEELELFNITLKVNQTS